MVFEQNPWLDIGMVAMADWLLMFPGDIKWPHEGYELGEFELYLTKSCCSASRSWLWILCKFSAYKYLIEQFLLVKVDDVIEQFLLS